MGGTLGVGGRVGEDDWPSLIRFEREPMGENCARGGSRIQIGLDDGRPGGIARNGVLEPEEVDPRQTGYACSGCLDLAVVGGSNSQVAAVAEGILAVAPGVFCGVGLFNADTDPLDVASLRAFETMLIFNSNSDAFDDGAAVGDAVSEYFDDGGQVVVTLFANGGYAITGAWTANGYNRVTHEWAPLAPDSFTRGDPTQGLIPDHPVLQGVEFLYGSSCWIAPIVATEGSSIVAAYASGTILAGAGPVMDAQGRTRNRVDLNIHPEDISGGFWYGDGFRLLANALMYY